MFGGFFGPVDRERRRLSIHEDEDFFDEESGQLISASNMSSPLGWSAKNKANNVAMERYPLLMALVLVLLLVLDFVVVVFIEL